MKYFLVLSLAAAASAKTIVEALTEGGATTLISVVSSVEPVLKALTGFAQPLTLFAPEDHAFADLIAAGFDPKNISALAPVLQYHAIGGAAFAPSTAGSNFFTTLQGEAVKVIVGADKSVTAQGSFKSTAAKVTKSITFDTPAAGIIHFIDQVLIPPTDVITTAVDAKLTKLVGAVQAASLVDTLSSLVNFTVLAPADAAFDAIASVTAGLSPSQLASVLTLHVVAGSIVYSTDIVKAGKIGGVATANGQLLDVVFNGTNVVIVGPMNNATVVVADVLVKGGVVHVIDTVLLPKDGVAGGSLKTTSGAVASGVVASLLMVAGLFAL